MRSDSEGRIALFGIGNKKLRLKVSGYLSDEFEISCVSDSTYSEDFLQGESFVTPEELSKEKYDYLLVLVENDKKREMAIKQLLELGIPRKKVVEPKLLLLEHAEYIPDLHYEICRSAQQKHFRNIVLGLSYSLRGLDYGIIQENCGEVLDLSWHGQDLYYNKRLLDTVTQYVNSQFLEKLICVFPFYYFNYDMSGSQYQFESGQIFANRGLNDWHNASMTNEGIRDYLLCNKLFGDRFWANKRWRKMQPSVTDIVCGDNVELANIWKKSYTKTLEENEHIFENLVCQYKHLSITLVIPPIMSTLIKKEEMQYYEAMKRSFYETVDQYKGVIKIVDLSDAVSDKMCFYDYEHLNDKGRNVFTNLLLKNI